MEDYLMKSNAIYVCSCADGVRRDIEGNTEEQVDKILARARDTFLGVAVLDIVDEKPLHRTGKRSDPEEDGDDEEEEEEEEDDEDGPSESPESFKKNADEDDGRRAFMNLPSPSVRPPRRLPPPPKPGWTEDKARTGRRHLMAIYVVACSDGPHTIRGFLDEPISPILSRANALHHVLALSLSEEIPLE
jgi:hypothetical protein